jgi:hypothetical protein
MKQNQNVRSGNRIVIQLDGKQVGLIQSVRMSDDYAPDSASGIGDIHVQEHVPTIARHTVSVSTMVMKRATLRQLGLASENGDGALQGLVFDIVSYDKDTGEELRKYMGCTYASGELEITKHAIVMSSGTFLATDVSGLAA